MKKKGNDFTKRDATTAYIKALEKSVVELNKRKESIETLTKTQARMATVLADVVKRLGDLEAVFNADREEISAWRRDYSLNCFE